MFFLVKISQLKKTDREKKQKEVSKKTHMNTLWGRKSAQTDKIHIDSEHWNVS